MCPSVNLTLDYGNGDRIEYTYNVWGELLSCTGSEASTLGVLNPLRYRGYVYDHETGLYYLQSRYYDPTVGRFINGDGLVATGQGILGNNMFAYCGNSPVQYTDESGMRHERYAGVLGLGDSERRDVTDEVQSALEKAALNAEITQALYETIFGEFKTGSTAVTYLEFYCLVDHGAAWDIKRKEPWENTIGTPYPGKDVTVSYAGMTMTPESLGNYTYGFLGYVYEIPLSHLVGGSYYAAGFPAGGAALQNEVGDWAYVIVGYQTAKGIYEGK